MDILSIADVGLSGGILVLTVYFFFLQSPYLFKRLGRTKFVPIMMQMTKLFFNVQVAFGIVLAALSFLRVNSSAPTIAAAAALAATSVNRFFVVPKALAAGRASAKERAENESHSTVDFVVQGGSKTETKTLHLTVVAVVFANVGAILLHLILLL